MAVTRPGGRVYTVRMPEKFAERIESWAVANDYIGPTGTVVWAEALRHLLAFALDALEGTNMDQQLRMAYYNGFQRGWGRTKETVITALNADEESHG